MYGFPVAAGIRNQPANPPNRPHSDLFIING